MPEPMHSEATEAESGFVEHTYMCGICGGRWSQTDGTDPQTHRRGCPNARTEDNVEDLAQFGHHPDPLIDAEVEVGRLQGLLAEAHGGLLRALDYRAATPEGLSIKYDVRDALRRTGFVGSMGEVSAA